MLNTFAKLLLTATALAPVGCTYAFVYLLDGEYVIALILTLAAAALILLCQRLLSHLRTEAERTKFKVTSVEAADRENIAFLILYVFPLLTTSVDALNWEVIVPVMVVFALVISSGYNYHFNPLLGLLGYHFFKVSTEEGVTYVLITKRQLRDTKDALDVAQVTEYIVIDVED